MIQALKPLQHEEIQWVSSPIVPAVLRFEEPQIVTQAFHANLHEKKTEHQKTWFWLVILLISIILIALLVIYWRHWRDNLLVDNKNEKVYQVTLINLPTTHLAKSVSSKPTPIKAVNSKSIPAIAKETKRPVNKTVPINKTVQTPQSVTQQSSIAQKQSIPSAQQLINQVRTAAASQSWQQAAARFAELTPAKRNAIEQYILEWTQDVQTFSDSYIQMHPGMDGRLVIKVTVASNGQLLDLRLLQSSGNPEIDQLALEATRAAAPFRPFTPAMGRRNRLSFTRIWLFGENFYFNLQ